MDTYEKSHLFYGVRYPLVGNLELTRRCQLDCKICYNAKEKKVGMNFDQIIYIIDSLKRRGCIYINLTGGEPLLRNDFNSIYEYIVKNGMRPSIESNGIIVNDGLIKLLKKYPPDKYHISLYSINKETYYNATKRKRDPQLIMDNILELKNNDINIIIRSPISIYNYYNIHEVYDFAKRNEIEFRYNPTIFWKQDGERCIRHRCKSEQLIPLLEKHEIYKIIYENLIRLEKSDVKIRNCVSGILEYNINAFGEMSHCIMFWNQKCNIIEKGFDYVWDEWFGNFRRIEDDFCLGKKLFNTNGECPWNFILKNESIDMRRGLLSFFFETVNDSKRNIQLEDILKRYNLTKEQYSFFEEIYREERSKVDIK